MPVSDNREHMLVSKIKDGTVVDKIPAGKSLQVMKILRIHDEVEETVAIAVRVSSKSMGVKDILKLTNRRISDDELKKIWLIAPYAKVSAIQDFKVVSQFILSEKEFSNEFTGLLTCINPTCATNYREPVIPKFSVMQREPLLVRCVYCDRIMLEENIRDQL